MKKHRAGFTMIELLVVVTIMIVLTAVAMVSYRTASQNARNSKRKADLESVRQSLVLYRTDNGAYPESNDFDSMIGDISDYLSSVSVTDPRNEDPYLYSYVAGTNGATLEICAYIEPDPGAEYCLTSP